MRILATISLLLLTPTLADEPGNGSVCTNITGFVQRVTDESRRIGATLLIFEGLDAVRFLDFVNHKVGALTNYRADKLIVEVRQIPVPGAIVATVRHGCVDTEMFALTPVAFVGAYSAVTIKPKCTILGDAPCL